MDAEGPVGLALDEQHAGIDAGTRKHERVLRRVEKDRLAVRQRLKYVIRHESPLTARASLIQRAMLTRHEQEISAARALVKLTAHAKWKSADPKARPGLRLV